MKIAWFTPFSSRSAIGRYSRYVASELARIDHVDVWHEPCPDPLPWKGTSIEFDPASPDLERKLALYDLIVYNFGDNVPFHAGVFEVSRRVKGIAILHDCVMQGFFAGYYLDRYSYPDLYIETMRRHYGAEAAEAARQSIYHKAPPVWETRMTEFPLFEEAIHGAWGVITHSEFLKRQVEARFTGPVAALPLAYEINPAPSAVPRQALGIPDGATVAVTIGNINPNKRTASVLRAIANLRHLPSPLWFAVAGGVRDDYRLELEQLAASLGIAAQVRFLGRVSDDALHAWATHADIFINLRYPNLEGASASVIEQMQYAKPVIVTDSGFFSELPSEAVRKIPLDGEIDALTAALGDLASQPTLRATTGERARQWASQRFSASNYAREFAPFATEVRSAIPLLRFSDTVAAEMRRMKVPPTSPLVKTVAARAAELFTPPNRR